MSFSRFALVVLPMALSACAARCAAISAPQALAWDAAARAEVEAATRRYATFLRTGPADSLAALYAADGELLSPGMAAIRGPVAILAFMAPFATLATVESADMTADALTVSGNSAMEWGTYRQTVTPRGQARGEYRGRFVAEWRRESDGRWRIAHLLVQPMPAGS